MCVFLTLNRSFYLLVDIQHTQCRRFLFILEIPGTSSVVTKLRHRQLRRARQTAVVAAPYSVRLVVTFMVESSPSTTRYTWHFSPRYYRMCRMISSNHTIRTCLVAVSLDTTMVHVSQCFHACTSIKQKALSRDERKNSFY